MYARLMRPSRPSSPVRDRLFLGVLASLFVGASVFLGHQPDAGLTAAVCVVIAAAFLAVAVGATDRWAARVANACLGWP